MAKKKKAKKQTISSVLDEGLKLPNGETVTGAELVAMINSAMPSQARFAMKFYCGIRNSTIDKILIGYALPILQKGLVATGLATNKDFQATLGDDLDKLMLRLVPFICSDLRR